MKLFSLFNNGLEKAAESEAEELISEKVSSFPQVLEISCPDEEALSYIEHTQAARRVLFAVSRTKDLEKFSLDLPFQEILSKYSFRIEVENVKGQDNRNKISKLIREKLEKMKINLNFKNPDFLLVIYYNGEEYFLGYDFLTEELNKRSYRLFVHPASFKGDLAYFFIYQVKFSSKDKLLVGFGKDGSLAIEAALYMNRWPLRQIAENKIWNLLFPNYQEKKIKPKKNKIRMFDESSQNVIAAKKNSVLAGVPESVEISRLSLDELDVKYDEKGFSKVIFYLTSKDEERINDIYYQLNYLIKEKGLALFIGRENWEFPVSENYQLVSKGIIKRGDSGLSYWLIKRIK